MASGTTSRPRTSQAPAPKKPTPKRAAAPKTRANATSAAPKKKRRAPKKKSTANAAAKTRPNDTSRLSRALVPMPSDVATALRTKKLRKAYDARPAFQRNDYLAWIERAKRPETRQNRLEQMLAELVRGDVYMKMAWAAKA